MGGDSFMWMGLRNGIGPQVPSRDVGFSVKEKPESPAVVGESPRARSD